MHRSSATGTVRKQNPESLATGGMVGWVLRKLRPEIRPKRLAVLERIALAPRHSLVLIEAEGRKLLVATAADGSPTFYPLETRQLDFAHVHRVADAIELQGYVW